MMNSPDSRKQYSPETGAGGGEQSANGGTAAGGGEQSANGGPAARGGEQSGQREIQTAGNVRKTNGGADRTSLLVEIFARICAFWGLILFVITMLLFMIPFLLFSYSQPDPTRNRRFIRYARVWMGVYLTGIGCPLRIKGREKFRKGENYIVVFNHNSLMDVPISSPGVPGANKTIAKTSFAKVPVFGMLYRTGSILVDRNSEASRRDSFIKMKEVLDMGMHMTLYPEGTRNLTDQPLKTFHNGAFRLALTTGKSIIPAMIFHSKYVLPANKTFFLRPHRLVLHFLDPVVARPGESVDELKDRVHQIMEDYYVTTKPKV